MRIIIVSICVLILLGHSVFAGGADVRALLKFNQSTFEVSAKASDKCPGDLLELRYQEADHNVLLTLGEKIAFSHIETSAFQEDGSNGCVYKIETKTKEHFISQIIRHQCKEKSEDFVKTQELKYFDHKLEYSYDFKGDKKAGFTCQFREVTSQRVK